MEIINYVKNCFNLYLNFDEGYKNIEKESSFWQSFLVYFGLSFLFFLALNIQDYWTTSSEVSKLYLILEGSIGSLIVSVIGLYFSYGITYGMLQFFEGKSNFRETFKFGLSVSLIPLIVFSIVNLIVYSLYLDVTFDQLTWSIFDIALFSIYILLNLAMLIWAFIISMKSFEKLHNLKRSKVIISLLTPVIIGLLVLGGLILALILIFG